MYKSAITDPAYKRCAANLKSLQDLVGEVLDEVATMEDREITRQEVKRDFGFTDKGIDLLRDIGVLKENSMGRNSRKTYSILQVMKCKVHFPGLVNPKVRQRTARTERINSELKRAMQNVCGVTA